MQTKLIDTVTNNEDYVRLRIFDGAFTPDNALEELLRLEKEIRKTERLIYEDTIEKLFNLLRTFSPNKGKNMNVTPNTTPVDTTFDRDPNFYYDENGIAVPFDVTPDSVGETTQPVTAFVAEDAADHPVTVH